MVGHSMGGIVAFDLAARYPELTSAVVILDAAVVLPSAARAASRHSSRNCVLRATGPRYATTWQAPCSFRPTTRSARSAS